MTHLQNALLSLIYDNDEICRLCLEIFTEVAFNINDDIKLTNDDKDYVKLSVVLAFLLGNEIADTLSPVDRVCIKCVKSAINCYLFINLCKVNNSNLMKLTENMTSSLENASKESRGYKKMYVIVDTDNFTCNTYFDGKAISPSQSKELCNNNKPLEKKENVDTKMLQWRKKNKFKMEESDDYISHKLNAGGSKLFSCRICSKMYADLESLQDHNKTHIQNPNYICGKCGKFFNNETVLKTHEKNHNIRITCSKCNRDYSTRLSFKIHMCRTERERPPLEKKYVCNDCNANFARKSTLAVHIKFEHGNGVPHICTWCGKKMYTRSSLKLHEVKHTKEKNYKCEICGGLFVTKASLLYHQRIHTGEKPFKCRFCDMTFLSTSRRADHRRKCHLEPSLLCGICPKLFRSYPNLHNHRKRHADPNSRLYLNKVVV